LFRYIVCLALLSSGCTAGIATVRLVAADKAVREAKEAGADVQATYQYTLAERYLDKAVEESTRSQYRATVDLARRAEAAAAEAIESMKGTRRIDLESAGEDISEDETKAGDEETGRKKDELDDESFEDGADEEEEEAPRRRESSGDDPFGDEDFEDEDFDDDEETP
jgi:hypothetical protein